MIIYLLTIIACLGDTETTVKPTSNPDAIIAKTISKRFVTPIRPCIVADLEQLLQLQSNLIIIIIIIPEPLSGSSLALRITLYKILKIC